MRRDFVEALADTWQGTAAVGHELDPEEWDTPTECPGWTVRDQISHMIGTEAMLLGWPSPPAAPTGLAHVLNPIGAFNEAWVDARRGLAGTAVLAEFEEVTRLRLAALDAMTDAELDADSDSPIGRVPYRVFMNVRVMDCWVHEQDIRRAVNRPGHLRGAAAEMTLTRLLGQFGYVVGKRAAPPEGTTVYLDITGPVERSVAVAMEGGRAVPLETVPDAPTTWIVTDSEAYSCLVAGRWTAEEALQRQKVAVHGDADIGRRIVEQLATLP